MSPSAAVLSACGSKPVPPPENSYDAADSKPAAVVKSPEKPVKIVEVPKPLPLPGQLQPEPGKAVEDKRSPEDRVADANKAATQQPTKYGYVNAVQ
ncbi:P-type conjugative transfer protein TrbG, partial [Mesorhizobium sp. M8A.F.Ca.ET.165.01.1.1]